MSKNKPKTIFPSYKQIYNKISTEQKKHYIEKINKINNRIDSLKNKLNFDDQHKQLTKKLINDYKKQNVYEKSAYQQFSDLRVVQNKRPAKYADSLNEYLQNSQQQENNYQAHLKFRKKALQRQLLADQDIDKMSKSKKLKDQFQEEQQFYRKLYEQQVKTKASNKKKINNSQFRQMQNRYASLIQNKKKLTQLYLPYVQALGQTNIVKWRVLN